MVRPLSLTALLVDDDEAVGLEYKTSLENIDMGLRRHTSNESANNALEDISQLRLPLHALLTDIMRPNGPDGLKFIERLRNANYATTVGGGLRLKYLPVVVISEEARRYKEHVKRIDGMIPVHEKPIWGDRLVEIIVDELAIYRAKILSELQHLGIAIVWKDGLYQVLPAYGAKRQKLIDTDRFVGNPAKLAANYTTLCLVNEHGAIARLYLEQFERLLNSPRVTERHMQAFLEKHPEFILGPHFDTYWPRPYLPREGSESYNPDFVLQPIGIRDAAWNWKVVDLKSPRAPLMPGSSFHQAFSHHVTKVIEQLRDYGEYFADPRNTDTLKRRFGGIVPRPKLFGLIGRLPRGDARDRYTTLMTRLTDVSITTYDEILEMRRSRVEQIESALTKWTAK